MKLPRPLEIDIQKACVDWLNTLHGVRVWRQNTGARQWRDKAGRNRVMKFGQNGQADLTGVGPGGVRIEIEIKRPGETPDVMQQVWLSIMQKSGAIAFWCDSIEACQEKMQAEMAQRLKQVM